MDRILGKGDYIVLGSTHPLAGSICQIMDARNPNYILVRLWLPCETLPIWEKVDTLPAYHTVEFHDMVPYAGDEDQLEAEICLRKL